MISTDDNNTLQHSWSRLNGWPGALFSKPKNVIIRAKRKQSVSHANNRVIQRMSGYCTSTALLQATTPNSAQSLMALRNRETWDSWLVNTTPATLAVPWSTTELSHCLAVALALGLRDSAFIAVFLCVSESVFPQHWIFFDLTKCCRTHRENPERS